jgi:PAS domain S-box-containing protein
MENLLSPHAVDSSILHWLFHFATQGIFTTDAELKVTEWNQWMELNTGRSAKEVMGKPLFDLYPDLKRRRMDQRYQKVLEGQVVILSNRFHRYLIPIETRPAGTRGSWMEQSVRIAPLIHEGKVIGSLTLIDDVSERVQRERELIAKANELARSNSDLEQFAHIASHDLKEPLNKISAFSDLLYGSVKARLDERESAFFDRIQSAIKRMRKLIDDILAYSRVGVSPSEAGKTDPRRAIDQALADLEIRVAQTGAAVDVSELPSVRASEPQLHQLFLNLFANALKFARPGVKPRVAVTAESETGGFVKITVTDNGIGFEQDYAEKIFLPFRRLHSRTAYEGSGIGLAVCKRIVELNGGTIQAQGRPNEGATFVIRLPAGASHFDRRSGD